MPTQTRKAKISASWRLAFPHLSRQARRGLLLCSWNMPNTPPSLRVNHFILSCSCLQLVLYAFKPSCTPRAQRTRILQPYLSHPEYLLALQQSKRSSTRCSCPAPASATGTPHSACVEVYVNSVLWWQQAWPLLRWKQKSPLALYLLLVFQIELPKPGDVFCMSVPSWVSEEEAGNNAVI